MLTVFETLYDLAVELQSNPSLKSFTLHHCPDKAIVQVRLQEGILHTVMTDESVHSKWAKTRIFCRNYVNRAQGVVTPKQMVSLLATVENLHPSEDERLAALASTASATFDVKRKKELVFALEKVTSREKLRKNSKFHWLNEQGGLFPRHLDRLIYMIGSDNFLLNSQQSKRYAPNRRQLIRNALISSGLVSATYQAQS